MIQRIQSLYLLLSATLYGLLFIFPFCTLSNPESEDSLRFYIHQAIQQTAGVSTEKWLFIPLILAILLILSSLTTLFLFKNRMLQAKLTRFFILLGAGLIVALIFAWDNISKSASALPDSKFSFVVVFPVVAMLFYYLANKAIIKDEKSIRSASRLR